MKNNSLIWIVCFTIIGFWGCLDLDSNMFNGWEVEEYIYNDYKDGEINLPDSFDILANELNPFVVPATDARGDKYDIHGVYLGNVNDIAKDTVILYCHGNTGSIDFYFQRAKLLYNLGEKSRYGIVLFDYRGYGKTIGSPTEATLKEDTRAVTQWLKDKGLTNDRFFVYGFSLGSIPAIDAAKDKSYPLNLSKLLVEAPIGSMDAMLKGGSGLSLPGSFLVNHTTDNIEDIKLVDQPLYVIHGDIDDFVDHAVHGIPVFDNHQGTYKELNLIENGNHDDIPEIMGFQNYLDAILPFVLRNK